MVIQKVVLAVVLALICIVTGCNCPCTGEKTCTMPESQVTIETASETAAVQ